MYFHLSPGKSGHSIKSSARIAPTAHISATAMIKMKLVTYFEYKNVLRHKNERNQEQKGERD